jgi:hypothetical protein
MILIDRFLHTSAADCGRMTFMQGLYKTPLNTPSTASRGLRDGNVKNLPLNLGDTGLTSRKPTAARFALNCPQILAVGAAK